MSVYPERKTSLVSHSLAKRIAAKFGAIASKALGIVFGYAVFNGALEPIFTYGKRWLAVTTCLALAFLVGMAIEYYIRKFYLKPVLAADSDKILDLKQPAEHHFKADPSRIARGVVLMFIISAFLSVAIFGSVAMLLLVVPVVLLTAADTYISLNAADRHFKASAIGALISGTFYGLFIGYALPIWSPG